MRTRSRVTALVIAALMVAGAPTVALAHVSQVLPVVEPSSSTPAVNDGAVFTITQVGSTMVAGGSFTSVKAPDGTTVRRTKAFAFDASSGALRSFAPRLNGDVNSVVPGRTPGTVYLAGRFTRVDGSHVTRVVLLHASTGAQVTRFRPPLVNGTIRTMTLVRNRLLLGGDFTRVGGVSHKGLASLNPVTGKLSSYMGVDVTVHHNNSRRGARGAVGVRAMEATPNGKRLIVVGNFRVADKLARVQVAMLTLGTHSSSVNRGWSTNRYRPLCFRRSFDTYMRGVSTSPDGRYFVITTTGGGNPGTLCDAAARFETGARGTHVQPTWVDYTGGDTLWAAEITSSAVYVGGHQRWLNNPDGIDVAKQGAVPRAGLAALDPESGLPLSWNPGRNPRGLAVFVLYATPSGLWMGSDTEYVGYFEYKRPRLAFFPLAGGAATTTGAVHRLPGKVLLGGPRASPSALRSIDYNGAKAHPSAVVDDRGMDWSHVRGAFLLGGTLFYGTDDGMLHRRTFTATTTGEDSTIDPYDDPAWIDKKTGSGQTYRGVVPTFYGQLKGVTGLFYANDRIYYTRSGHDHLYWRWFNADSGIVGGQVFTADGGRNWSNSAGMFRSGRYLYFVSRSSGKLSKVSFTGGHPSGKARLADASVDWRGNALFVL